MAGHGKEKQPLDEVHRNQIMCELIRKELRTQKLHTQYSVNPNSKVHTFTRKPMSWHDNMEEPADARFLKLFHYTAQGPKMKYPEPQTESQEIGWDTEPLTSTDWTDRRLRFSHHTTELTRYMAEIWRGKEQK
ncbi:protein FAM183A [Tachyglossus aculeatus]|uniref:protein FAM183A n=1 Tax=Tachyglossus aculeatus TaxID=9261 RepID=UPI0018F42F5D|nr:protein FAM183A [Tachyglossus aculeatus]